jgi:hypothetical protein
MVWYEMDGMDGRDRIVSDGKGWEGTGWYGMGGQLTSPLRTNGGAVYPEAHVGSSLHAQR